MSKNTKEKRQKMAIESKIKKVSNIFFDGGLFYCVNYIYEHNGEIKQSATYRFCICSEAKAFRKRLLEKKKEYEANFNNGIY